MYQKIVKSNNENKIFYHIFNLNESFTIPDLAKSVNMTFPTVKRIINEFLEKEIIIEGKMTLGNVGRRALKYMYNENFCYSIGVEISNEKIKIVLINARGNKIKKEIFSLEEEITLENFKNILKNYIEKLDKDTKEKLIGIGVSIPGIYNTEDNFIEFSHNKTYKAKDFFSLEQYFGLKLWIENEANMSVLAEAILGDYKKFKDFYVITINKSISSSFFYKINTENNEYFFKAARTHYMKISPETKISLGDIISVDALENRIKKDFKLKNKISLKEFFYNEEFTNKKEGLKIINNFIIYLSMLIKNTIYIYNPQKIIICGEISEFKNILLKSLIEIVYNKDNKFYRGKETLTFSKFKGDSSVLGAAIFPLVDTMM